jgi:plastocyanin
VISNRGDGVQRLAFAALLICGVCGIAAADGGPVSGTVEIVDAGGAKRTTVREVLVYLDGVETPVPASLLEPTPELKSEDKVFVPHVLVVPVGEEVTFPNVDEIMHNVFSITRGNRFDLGLYKSGARKNYVFETPGVARIYCNIHPQMSAFVLVRDNPYFACRGGGLLGGGLIRTAQLRADLGGTRGGLTERPHGRSRY